MDNTEKLRAAFSLPPIDHIGVVVRDIGKAMEYYSSLFGLGPFTVYDLAPEKQWYREKPSYFKLRMAKAMWGNIELELLQPLEGESPHKDFLNTRGEGMQHFGFPVSNYEETFDRFLQAGFTPLTRIEAYLETYGGNLKACYFETRKMNGIIFEIMWRSWVNT